MSQPLSAVSQPLSSLGPAMHMHTPSHKKDSSDLDIAVAPPHVNKELVGTPDSCIPQPWKYSQHNQQEILEEFDPEMEEFCGALLRTDDQNFEHDGPSLWPTNTV